MSLTIALPSKGRLKERSLEIFSEAGFKVELPEDTRSYFGRLSGELGELEIAFLSASEIARELISGSMLLGITGEDLARESTSNPDQFLDFLVPLKFGQADVVIGIPEAWIDVSSMVDLGDIAAEFRAKHGRRMKIATKYWNLTQNHFAEHHISAYRIVESLGATEGAPASGAADLIVDITSTGSTLKANNLKQIKGGTILKSEANLIASKSGKWIEENKLLSEHLRLAIANVVGI